MGSGFDLGIHGGGDTARSFTNFPYSYTDTLGRGDATFTGAKDFTPENRKPVLFKQRAHRRARRDAYQAHK